MEGVPSSLTFPPQSPTKPQPLPAVPDLPRSLDWFRTVLLSVGIAGRLVPLWVASRAVRRLATAGILPPIVSPFPSPLPNQQDVPGDGKSED